MHVESVVQRIELHASITNNEKFVLQADDIEKVKTGVLAMRMEDGLTIHEMIAYNKETVRIALMGGDISKRKMYMQYFGTTYRQLKEVSS